MTGAKQWEETDKKCEVTKKLNNQYLISSFTGRSVAGREFQLRVMAPWSRVPPARNIEPDMSSSFCFQRKVNSNGRKPLS